MLKRAGGIFGDKPRRATATHVLIIVPAVTVTGHRADEARVRIHLPYPMVAGVRDIGMIVLIEDNGFRRVQHRLRRRLPVSIVSIPAHTGEGGNQPGLMIDLAHSITAFVDNIHITGIVDGDTDDIVQPRLHGRMSVIEVHRQTEPIRTDRHQPPVVVTEVDADRIAGQHHQVARHQWLLPGFVFRGPASRDGFHQAGSRVVPTNPVRLRVGDIHHIVRVEGDRRGPGQIHFQRRAITIKPMFTGAHDRGDNSGFTIDFSNPVTAGITNIKIVTRVTGDVQRQIQSGFSARPFVAAVAGLTDPGKIMDGTLRKIDATNPVAA